MRKQLLLGMAAALLVAGCGTTASHTRTSGPSLPEITSIEVGGASAEGGQQWVLGEDFVMLNVGITNPEGTGVSGEIACKPSSEEGSRGVRHPFDVDARSRRQVKVPVDDRKPYSYTLRCRLQYIDNPVGGGQRTSDWVEVAVPAQGA